MTIEARGLISQPRRGEPAEAAVRRLGERDALLFAPFHDVENGDAGLFHENMTSSAIRTMISRRR